MRVLVTHGSNHGGTLEIAEWVATTLREAGHQVDVVDARTPEGLEGYDAVIVGGALYAFRWPWRVYRFLARHRDELVRMPVWFFSSGPLDDSAKQEIAPVRSVARWMKRVQARGHQTFGGRLAPDAKGFIAQSLIKRGMVGDHRDFQQVRAWTIDVAEQLLAMPEPLPHPQAASVGRSKWLRRVVSLLCLFTGVTALAGGVELMTWRTGADWLPPLSVLQHTPFADFFIPGLLLFLFVGLTNLSAAILEGRRSPWGERAAMLGGAAIVGWIVSEMVLLRAPSLTEVGYLLVGALTLAGSAWLFSRRRAAVRLHSL
ncbi:MAG: flavodoxin domain-containing protein [Myxococcota bacterium]